MNPQPNYSTPKQSASRADSPMQETGSFAHATSVRRAQSSQLPGTRTDASNTTFTAVNGERPRPAFRPDSSAPPLSRPQSGAQVLPSMRASPPDPPRSVPSEERSDTVHDPHSNKRKRANSAGVGADSTNDVSHTEGLESSKKRSAAASATPAPASRADVRARPASVASRSRQPSETHIVGTYARERSPDSTRWNNGEPPPPPRFDIQATLAESIQREHLALKRQQPPRAPSNTAEAARRAVGSSSTAPTSASPQRELKNGTHDNAQNNAQDDDTDDDDDDDDDDEAANDALDDALDDSNDEDSQSESLEERQRKILANFKPQRKRNFSNRTKTGCHTCRSRKKKCDEMKPYCGNCVRGGFVCNGYGAKPAGNNKVVRHSELAEQQYQAMAGEYPPLPQLQQPPPSTLNPPQFSPTPPDPLLPSQTFPPWEPLRASPPDHEPSRPYPDSTSTANRRFGPWLPTIPASGPVPPAPLAPTQHGPTIPAHALTSVRRPSETDVALMPPLILPDRAQHPPPDPWAHPPVSSQRGEPSSAASTSTSAARDATSPPAPAIQTTDGISERDKMLTGRPYLHFLDAELRSERESCMSTLDTFNETPNPNDSFSEGEAEQLFKSIFDPSTRFRNNNIAPKWRGPKGTCGANVIIETPFNCDYGYNLHFGDDVAIGRNCYMQDACEIYIGNRTVVGPDVRFYCMTSGMEPNERQGSQGTFTAGIIKIEDGVLIGAGATILAFRTIGKGATVGAGSVVTKDVKPYTVVAGNPAKFVRRVTPGKTDERRHNQDIQEENDRMLKSMQIGNPVGQRSRPT